MSVTILFVNGVTESPLFKTILLRLNYNNKTEIMKTGNVLLGVLAGAAVGAALGILFAPDKGSATRKKIADKGHDYSDEMGEKFESFIDAISKKFESIKKEAKKMASNGELELEKAEAEIHSALK